MIKNPQSDVSFKKIKRILDFVWDNPNSSFYRDKYSKLGINLIKDFNALEDFKKLPFLTKDEIVKSDPFERFFLPWKKFGTVSISSGTVSTPDSLSIIFRQIGIRKVNVNVNPDSSFKPTAIMRLMPQIQAAKDIIEGYVTRQKTGKNFIDVMGDINDLSLSAKIAAKLKVDVLFTSPTILYFFIPFLKKEYDLKKIKRISLMGEYCSKQKASLFRKLFSRALIVRRYGLSEGQGESVGLYCKYLNTLMTGYFHPSPKYYLETIDFMEGSELVVTHLHKNGFPLIRYKTGDAVEMEDFKCKCGQLKRFKVLGRINHDVIRIHGTSIYAHIIENALLSFYVHLDEPLWQLHVFEDMVQDKIMPRLKLQVVVKEKNKAKQRFIKATLEKGISEKLFLSAKKTLVDLVAEKVFLPLEIEFVDSFQSIGKHRYIVSHLD
ncbi:MAG: hypothetical protein WCV81_05325 [Microgenomates group bacterium]|jgi:phenylacetate-CoA ligase